MNPADPRHHPNNTPPADAVAFMPAAESGGSLQPASSAGVASRLLAASLPPARRPPPAHRPPPRQNQASEATALCSYYGIALPARNAMPLHYAIDLSIE